VRVSVHNEKCAWIQIGRRACMYVHMYAYNGKNDT
jgi:hypothetical protein